MSAKPDRTPDTAEVAHHRADTADGQRDDNDTDKYAEGASNTDRI